jgi:protein SCO1
VSAGWRDRKFEGGPNLSSRAAATWLALALALPIAAPCHETRNDERLSKLGPAPEFVLTDQDGRRVALKSLRGHVVAVTFIFASCTDTCPLLTATMAGIQDRLGSAFGRDVQFVSITVDPERDTPAALKRYAEAHRANPAGWSFLTGTPDEIREVAKGYGVYYKKTARGDVDHTFLTTLIDRHGTMRVQYMGVRFDPDEMLRDLRSLSNEAKSR